ncbi:helix-turn-helix domain-containing protein [Paenibacillus sp. FSL K6-2859]|uniref:helix-turn-helix domain-containing protein n=1 Tax=Paenibacillus sp. FSL K6-2859 TaxID=2921482 RepID=UPI0030F61A5D
MDENLLGQFIAEKRKTKGMSLREIAEKAELSPSQLSKIERGLVKSPNEDTLDRISYALNEDRNAIYALAGKLNNDAKAEAALYIPELLGGYAFSEVSATYERHDVLSSVLDDYATKEASQIFTMRIIRALEEYRGDLSDEDTLYIAREMVAAFELTTKRLQKSKKD